MHHSSEVGTGPFSSQFVLERGHLIRFFAAPALHVDVMVSYHSDHDSRRGMPPDGFGPAAGKQTGRFHVCQI
jgi:hypothetical protein